MSSARFKALLRPGPARITGKAGLGLLLLLVLLLRFSPTYPWLLERMPDAALARLDQPWLRDPGPATVRGERLLARGDARAALKHLERAGTLGASDTRWGIDVVDALDGSGLHDRALTQAQALLQFEPDSGRLYRILGQGQLRLGQTGEGLAALEKATQLAPHDPAAWLAYAEARSTLDGPGTTTLGVWQSAVQRNPRSAPLRHGLAHAYVELARYAEAEPLLAGLERQPPPSHPAERGTYVRAWYARGVVLHRLRPDPERLAQAQTALEQARTLSPQFPDTYYELGLLLQESGNQTGARQALENAVRLKPQAPPFWYQLSMLCRTSDPSRSREAEARFQLLVRTEREVADHAGYLATHPEDLERRIQLARLLIQRQDLAHATQQLTAVLRANPHHPTALRLLSSLHLRAATGASVP